MAEFDPWAWATGESARLRSQAEDVDVVGDVVFPKGAASVEPRAAAALEMLRLHASGDFYRTARSAAADKSCTARDYLRSIAAVLDQAASAQSTGLLSSVPYEVRSRVDSATDLMEQVDLLLTDREVHPAAPVALAGAALEQLLRSLWVQAGEPKLDGKPGINAYAEALRKVEELDRLDVKNITAWADMRNSAAHGHFDSIDLMRARHMVDGVNVFMQRRAPRS